MRKSALILVLSACATTHYPPTTVATESLRADDQCVVVPNADKLVTSALTAVQHEFVVAGIATQQRVAFNAEKLPQSVCFLDSNKLGVAGLTVGSMTYIALRDKNNQPVDMRNTALVHEFIHVVLDRSCLLPRCDGDGEHKDIRLWIVASDGQKECVESRARTAWRAGL